jgi:hypothetical protein
MSDGLPLGSPMRPGSRVEALTRAEADTHFSSPRSHGLKCGRLRRLGTSPTAVLAVAERCGWCGTWSGGCAPT